MGQRFPLFIDLTGKPVAVVGGGAVGCRRAEVLASFGASVTVIAPVVQELPEDAIWIARPYQRGDLAGMFLVVAATDDRTVNQAVCQEAREQGILVNVSDCPDTCDFFFPAICRGERLTAGLVGDGSDHRRTARAAKAIRKVLEEMEP